jgi:acetyl/propionyl-CoA carboxylase alpha subunit
MARACGYVGAGTVEFLVDEQGSFWFLEMNTRLQVEHPVTEAVTGLDLVALQLSIADGLPLGFEQRDVVLHGHCIEARVYAEDTARGFVPCTGQLHRFDLGSVDTVRVDAGFATGNVVSPHYDAMLAKVIASGPTRDIALARLHRAVQRAWVPGVITNLPLLRDVLDHPAFRSGALHTGFLAEHGLPQAPPSNASLGILAALAIRVSELGSRPWAAHVTSGWRLQRPAQNTTSFSVAGQELVATWRLQAGVCQVGIGDSEHVLRVHGRDGDVVSVEVDGLREDWRMYVHAGDRESFVQRLPRFPLPAKTKEKPGSCTAPTPGTILEVLVRLDQQVVAGAPLLVIEAMKMEQTLISPLAGTVTSVRVGVGDTVDQGQLLVTVELEAE